MTELTSIERLAARHRARFDAVERRVILCAGTGCVANGALAVRDRLVAAAEAVGAPVRVELREEPADEIWLSKSGCQGFCQLGPLVAVEPDGLLYVRVRPGDAEEIVTETLVGRRPIERLLYREPRTGTSCRGVAEIPFYARQQRVVLRDSQIDPESVEEYLARGGYRAAERAHTELTPEGICAELIGSGLRGRGGGGYPTGHKWAAALRSPGARKFIICNGDEGDPGAFMDRSLMEGNPHSVLEGMLIAARAVGAREGYVYVRAEYPLAVQRMRQAVSDAERVGVLGPRIFGLDRGFVVHVKEGAGAFVCGEETALIASIEGERGMPRPKPPFPSESGLFGCPTVINNVETLATVPDILRRGAEAFAAVGTRSSPGTKTFALTGHVANTGLIEVPFGSTLREIVYDIGGGVTGPDGVASDAPFKVVQIGGPSGGCLTWDMVDRPLDFDSLREVGAMVGSGGLVVMNQSTCVVSLARFFMQFTQNESCGKCVPCREGTRQMLALLDDLVEGRGTPDTLALLEQTAKVVRMSSLCGLGKSAPSPVLATLRWFRAEYEAHVNDHVCPAGQCDALAFPWIDEARCNGCGLCAKRCPTEAIVGQKKAPHRITDEKCIRCGACLEACRREAITKAPRRAAIVAEGVSA